MDYRQLVRQEAQALGLDPNIAEATLLRESGGNPNAVSSAGARGPMQLMPGTAKDLGVNLNDPVQNVKGGVRYLKQQIDQYGVPAGIAAYNAGPGRVSKAGGDFNALPPETRSYVPAVMNKAAELAQGGGRVNQEPNIGQIMSALEKAKAANDTEAVAEISGMLTNKFSAAKQKAQAAGDAEAVAEIEEQMGKFGAAPAAPQTPAAPQAAPKKQALTDSGMNSDPTWIANAKRLYKETQGKDFQGKDAEAADWLKNYVAQTNWNLAGTAGTIYDASTKLSPEGKKALLSSMQAYEDAPISWESAGRAAKGIFTDPTTYATGFAGGIGKLLGRKAIAEGAKQVIKEGIDKQLVSQATKRAVASGAGYGAVNDLGQQGVQVAADGQDKIDLGRTGIMAGVGGATGGVLNKIADVVTGNSALRKFARRSGSEENARMDAEIAQDMADIAQQSSKTRGGSPRQMQAKDANDLERRYINEAKEALKDIPLENKAQIDFAINNRNALKTTDRKALEATPGGKEVLAVIDKADRTATLTKQLNSRGGVLGTIGRQAVNLSPAYLSAAAGVPVPVTVDMLKAITNKLGGKTTRADMIDELINVPSVKTAKAVQEALKESKATKGLNTLQDMGLANLMAGGREAAAASRESATAAAKKQEERIAAAAAKAEEKRMIADGARIIAERKKAQAPISAGRKTAELDPNAAIAELQGKDPTYLLGLSNPLGVPRNEAQMAEFSKVIREQMLARQAREEAAKAAQKGGEQVLDTRAGVLRATRVPLGGPFQELLQGGRSNLNLTTDEAVRGLRILDKKTNDPVLKDAIQRIRSSSGETPGAVPDPNAFYGVQNAMRRLQEQGVLSGGQQSGILSGINPVRNPISYAANVRNAEQAAALAESSAPSKALAQFARKVAGTKSIADKEALIADRLKKASPDEAAYLEQFVSPLTSFGKK